MTARIFLLALLAGVDGLGNSTALNESVSSRGTVVRIMKYNHNPQTCLAVAGGVANGHPIVVEKCSKNPSQHWIIVPNNPPKIVHAVHTDKCIDIHGRQSGVIPMVWDCNGTPNQRIQIVKGATGNGYHMKHFAENTHKCVDSKSDVEETPVAMIVCGKAQKWDIPPVSASEFTLV
jgi:hypothetical protein